MWCLGQERLPSLYVEQMLFSIDSIHRHLKISWVERSPEEQRNNSVKGGVRPAVDVLMRKKEVKLAQSKTSTEQDYVLHTASVFMMTSYKGSVISILQTSNVAPLLSA